MQCKKAELRKQFNLLSLRQISARKAAILFYRVFARELKNAVVLAAAKELEVVVWQD
jgi:hypothetical protein